MKKLLIITLFICNWVNSQNGISAAILHDVKLGLGQDYKHNDGKHTLDILTNVNLEGKQFEWYYFAVQLQYERAELKSGYFSRYGVNAIWNFNKLVIDDLTIGVGIGLHMVERPNTGGLGAYSGTVEVSYPITKSLSIIAKNELLRRPDLETPQFGYNLAMGLNYKL